MKREKKWEKTENTIQSLKKQTKRTDWPTKDLGFLTSTERALCCLLLYHIFNVWIGFPNILDLNLLPRSIGGGFRPHNKIENGKRESVKETTTRP